MEVIMEKIQYEIESLCEANGTCFVGYSNVEYALSSYLKKYPFAISFGIRLSDAVVDEIDFEPTFTYYKHYRSLNFLIDQITLYLVILLQKHGFSTYPIAASQSIPTSKIPHSGTFSHKLGAILSGMGWLGKSGLFIHKEYGPRVRLGTVLTDCKICTENKILESKCGKCNLCKEICPSKAIKGILCNYNTPRDEIIDVNACSQYMFKKLKHIGRGSVCGICMKVCPQYKPIKKF